MKNKKIIIVLTILAVGFLTLLVGYVLLNNNTFDQPGTTKLTQGTQTRYEDISIGLSNVEKGTAWLSILDSVSNTSSSKQVKTGETIEVYGYQISISSVKEAANPSILPGSSQGYIKFVVNKK